MTWTFPRSRSLFRLRFSAQLDIQEALQSMTGYDQVLNSYRALRNSESRNFVLYQRQMRYLAEQ